jgi:hypothetical protein
MAVVVEICGVEETGGGTEETGSGAEAGDSEPNITDTRLIGLRILPGISRSTYE